jgi:hypothetical protein
VQIATQVARVALGYSWLFGCFLATRLGGRVFDLFYVEKYTCIYFGL